MQVCAPRPQSARRKRWGLSRCQAEGQGYYEVWVAGRHRRVLSGSESGQRLLSQMVRETQMGALSPCEFRMCAVAIRGPDGESGRGAPTQKDTQSACQLCIKGPEWSGSRVSQL